LDCIPCVKINADAPLEYEESFLDKIVSKYYAPFILHPIVKVIIVLFYIALLFVSISFIPQMELGLDQKIALPSDSYLVDYFEDQSAMLKVGVPVYFVIQGVNTTNFEGKKKVLLLFLLIDSIFKFLNF